MEEPANANPLRVLMQNLRQQISTLHTEASHIENRLLDADYRARTAPVVDPAPPADPNEVNRKRQLSNPAFRLNETMARLGREAAAGDRANRDVLVGQDPNSGMPYSVHLE